MVSQANVVTLPDYCKQILTEPNCQATLVSVRRKQIVRQLIVCLLCKCFVLIMVMQM